MRHFHLFPISLIDVSQFGYKTIGIKIVVKALPKLFGHNDKNVRAEVFPDSPFDSLMRHRLPR